MAEDSSIFPIIDNSQFPISGGASSIPSFGGVPLSLPGLPGAGFVPAITTYSPPTPGSGADPGLASGGTFTNVVEHKYASATRADPPKNQFINMLNAAAADSGIVNIVLFSAAQEVLKNFGTGKQDWENFATKPDRTDLRLIPGTKSWQKLVDGTFQNRPGTVGEPWRTGSVRHDSGLAGDIYISFKNTSGSVVRADSKNQEGKNAIIRFCVAALKYGARAFGHNSDGSYMTTDAIHIDMLGGKSGNGFNRSLLGLWGNDNPHAEMPTWLSTPIKSAFRQLRNPNNTSNLFDNDAESPELATNTVNALATGKVPLTKSAASQFTSATGSPVKLSKFTAADALATKGQSTLSEVAAFNAAIGGGGKLSAGGANAAEKAFALKNIL